MKVLKMNDCDWVCAKNEQSAKTFYEKETGFTNEEIENVFIGEVDLNGKKCMYLQMNYI